MITKQNYILTDPEGYRCTNLLMVIIHNILMAILSEQVLFSILKNIQQNVHPAP